MSLSRAVFLDRDGVLIEEREYLHRVDQVVFTPGTVGGLVRLANAGFKLIIVTNQSGVGRGYYTMEDVDKVHVHILSEFQKSGVSIQKIYVAPEAPDQPSRARKPSPQFLFDARDEFGIDLANSFIIGDKWIDLECGWNASVRKSILVRTGYGRKTEQSNAAEMNRAIVVDDLSAAADWILTQPVAVAADVSRR